jgi:hypothetical protein
MDKGSKAGFEMGMLRLEQLFIEHIRDTVITDPDFPFHNIKLFFSLAGLDLLLEFEKISQSKDPKKVEAFNKKCLELKRLMIKRGLLDPATKSWKTKFKRPELD